MKVLETDRLILRRLAVTDAEFILDLVNQPSFLRFIGDKGVRSLDDARNYVLDGPVRSYERFGFGLCLTELKEPGYAAGAAPPGSPRQVPIGICGLVKRETLADVDLGFAFLPQFWKRGYAFEAAAAVLSYAGDVLGLDRIVAITNPDNDGSIKVLEKLGFRFERMVRLSDDGPEIRLFATERMSCLNT